METVTFGLEVKAEMEPKYRGFATDAASDEKKAFSGHVKASFALAEDVGVSVQKRLAEGAVFADIITRVWVESIRGKGHSGLSCDIAASYLEECWLHGEEFRAWHQNGGRNQAAELLRAAA